MEDKRPNYYSGDMEATVPTPPDQQDVNALDMVGDAAAEFVDIVRGDLGLKDGPLPERDGTSADAES